MKDNLLLKKKAARVKMVHSRIWLAAGAISFLGLMVCMVLYGNEFFEGAISPGKLVIALVVGLFVLSYSFWSKAERLKDEIKIDELIEKE